MREKSEEGGQREDERGQLRRKGEKHGEDWRIHNENR